MPSLSEGNINYWCSFIDAHHILLKEEKEVIGQHAQHKCHPIFFSLTSSSLTMNIENGPLCEAILTLAFSPPNDSFRYFRSQLKCHLLKEVFPDNSSTLGTCTPVILHHSMLFMCLITLTTICCCLHISYTRR